MGSDGIGFENWVPVGHGFNMRYELRDGVKMVYKKGWWPFTTPRISFVTVTVEEQIAEMTEERKKELGIES